MKTTVKSIIKSLNIKKGNTSLAFGSRMDSGSYVFTNSHILYELSKNNELNNNLLKNVIDYNEAIQIAGYKNTKNSIRNTCKLKDGSLELTKNNAYKKCYCQKINTEEFTSLFNWFKKIKNASFIKFCKYWIYVLDKNDKVIDKTMTNIDFNMKLNFKYLVNVFKNISNLDHGCNEILMSEKAIVFKTNTTESIIMKIFEPNC